MTQSIYQFTKVKMGLVSQKNRVLSKPGVMTYRFFSMPLTTARATSSAVSSPALPESRLVSRGLNPSS